MARTQGLTWSTIWNSILMQLGFIPDVDDQESRKVREGYIQELIELLAALGPHKRASLERSVRKVIDDAIPNVGKDPRSMNPVSWLAAVLLVVAVAALVTLPWPKVSLAILVGFLLLVAVVAFAFGVALFVIYSQSLAAIKAGETESEDEQRPSTVTIPKDEEKTYRDVGIRFTRKKVRTFLDGTLYLVPPNHRIVIRNAQTASAGPSSHIDWDAHDRAMAQADKVVDRLKKLGSVHWSALNLEEGETNAQFLKRTGKLKRPISNVVHRLILHQLVQKSIAKITGYVTLGESWIFVIPYISQVVAIVDHTIVYRNPKEVEAHTRLGSQSIKMDFVQEDVVSSTKALVLRVGASQFDRLNVVTQNTNTFVDTIASQLSMLAVIQLSADMFDRIIRGLDFNEDVPTPSGNPLTVDKDEIEKGENTDEYIFIDPSLAALDRKVFKDLQAGATSGIDAEKISSSRIFVRLRKKRYLSRFNWEMAHLGIRIVKFRLERIIPPKPIVDVMESISIGARALEAMEFEIERLNKLIDLGVAPNHLAWTEALRTLSESHPARQKLQGLARSGRSVQPSREGSDKEE